MNIEKILMCIATVFIVVSISVMADIIVTQQAEIHTLQKKCR